MNSSATAVAPRDARLIALLLAANGAEESEEAVIRMLVEFAHRTPSLSRSRPDLCLHASCIAGYTTDVLTDSLLYAEHARSGQTSTTSSIAPVVPSLDDIRLAVQARTEGSVVPKEVRSLFLCKK